ncbi:CopD family protein [Neomegalonema sp.]|uniref:copper resistance CopC/CopD family protein n=1 Tax=Neomegalonema sp. TaxID=2039713 RepID=UPI00261EA6D7|nr:CopD family protein [Neomegalonema sp.]MDD2869215.1 CopD family protein [Neomegalonema sp.]
MFRPSSFLRAALAFLLLSLALVLASQEARAHAAFLSSFPEPDAVLDQAPEAAILRFAAASRTGPDGVALDLTAATTGGREIRAPLPAGAAEGPQVFAWRVASADGHPLDGSVAYSIAASGGEAAPPALAPSQADSRLKPLVWLTRALTYAGLFFGLGGAVFGALVPPLPARARQIAQDLGVAGLIALPLSVSLQGLDALGRPLNDAIHPEVWRAGLATSSGSMALMAAAALALGLLALALPKWRPPLALAGLAAGASALALGGQAAAAAPQWLTRPAVFLHAAGLVVWIGALAPLGFLLARSTPQASAALGRFSRWLPWALAPVVVSGIALAAVRLGRPGPGWLTAYGLLLLCKILLLLLLLALALWSRRRLMEPALEGSAPARRRLRDAVGLAAALTLGMLGLTAGLRAAAPPRVLTQQAGTLPALNAPAAAPAAEGVLGRLEGPEARAEIRAEPGHAGPLRIDLRLASPESGPLEAQALRIGFSRPQSGIEPFFYVAKREPDGLWRVERALLPLSGLWRVEAEARLSRFEIARLEGEIEIAP